MQEHNKMTAQQEQIQKQKVTVTGGGPGSQLNALFTWGFITLVAVGIIGFCLWTFGGFPGKFIDGSILCIGSLCIGWFLWTWAANRYYHTQRLATNSRVIETNNVTVWFDNPDNYVNFTAEIAAAANTLIAEPKEPLPYEPPTFEENYAKSVYNAKEHDGLTWEDIAERYNTTVGIVRGKHKEYIRMLERGRVI
jgi:hypothetical protein